MNRFRSLLAPTALSLALVACAPTAQPPESAKTALRVAQEFVDGYYHQFPEEAFEVAYPDTPMDRLGDHGQAAMDAWRAREDAWLTELRAINPTELEGTDAAIPYAFTLDRLQASATRRVCRMELWSASPTFNGWQATLSSTFARQPVTTPEERSAALARLHTVPAFIDADVANLRLGMKTGYLAPKSGVAAVLLQVDAMLKGTPESSPFYDPAARAADTAFQASVRSIVSDEINAAIARYRTFLAKEYAGRDGFGVASNPDGAACYAASVRFHTSLALDPKAIHETGLRRMQEIQTEMHQIANKSFGTDNLPALLERFRSSKEYTFRTADEVIAYNRAAVDRAAVAVHDWFGFVPDAAVSVIPFPAYQKASGGGFYSAGSPDGSKPGTYELGTYEPQTISRVGQQSTAFHETYPGHHLQFSVALFGKRVHPVLRYIYVAGMAEGWGLYSETLADEMGLYSSEADRMGMLSNQALRAARLVVDPGMHVHGWTRTQAIDYMLANTAENRASIESEVDRYLAAPGQATAYMTGSLEIQRLRHEAESTLGAKFDIKGFHDTILADGAVSLPMLRTAVERWVSARAGK